MSAAVITTPVVAALFVAALAVSLMAVIDTLAEPLERAERRSTGRAPSARGS